MNDRTKVLLLAAILAGGGAAAWFLYLEEMVMGGPAPTPPKPAAVAKAPAPAPAPAKPAAEAPKPAAEAPKPAAAEAPKPAAAEPPKPAVAEAPKPVPVPASAPPMVLTQAAPPPKLAEKPAAEKPAAEKPAAEKPAVDAPAPMVVDAPKPAEPPREKPPAAVVAEPVELPPVRGNIPGPRFNDLMTAVLYRDAKAVDELIAFGKWAEKADSRGLTPLMLASLLGEAGMAESLLKAGANPNRPGPGGSTATSFARERSDATMLKLLEGHGGR